MKLSKLKYFPTLTNKEHRDAWKLGCQLIDAAADGKVDEIVKLLDAGVDINFQRKVSFMTP